MKDFREVIDKALESGKVLAEEELTAVSGGEGRPDWVIVEEGNGTFTCYGQPHRSVFHYTVEDRHGYNWWIHVTGICSVCGAKNDYYILDPK